METNALAIATEYADALAMREHIEAHGGYEEVTEKIRDAMKQRGRRRRSEDASAVDNGWEMADADEEVEDEDKKVV